MFFIGISPSKAAFNLQILLEKSTLYKHLS